MRLPAKDFGKNQWGDDRGVGFDDEFRGFFSEFAPSDFFVGNCTGITSVAGGRVADLAEVAPEWHIGAAEVLVEHGDNANREVACDAAADLKEADGCFVTGRRIPISE